MYGSGYKLAVKSNKKIEKKSKLRFPKFTFPK